MITVKTASGRQYDIDLDAKTIKREGDAKVYSHKSYEGYDDPHHGVVNTFTTLDVVPPGRLQYRLDSGEWWTSSRVVEGLEVLVDALDS